jgi:5,5'-dehydrodivanillate O-demethylase
MAVETQGRIYDRTNEHLGTSDKGVIMLRQMIKESIEAVQQGHDPYGLIRDVELNDCIVFGTQAETTEGVVAAV